MFHRIVSPTRCQFPGWFLLGLLLCSPLQSQGEPSSIFGDRIEVRIVNLEVVVTDRQGNRVEGLGASDFRLRVDGEDVPIGFFSEISEGHRRATVASETEATGSLATASNPTGAAPGEAVGTNYLVFIDRGLKRDRNQVLRGISEQIYQLGPQDRMALVRLKSRELEMLSGWTQSVPKLERALDKAMNESFATLDLNAEVDGLSSLRNLDTAEEAPTDPEFAAAAEISRVESRIEQIVHGVTATMRSFAQPPGRKVLLLLSGGWPLSPCDYALGQRSLVESSGFCEGRGPELYRPMYEIANRLGYTIYPIDVPGGGSIDISAAEDDFVGLGRNGPPLGGVPSNVVNETFRESEFHATLHQLANETGGLPMINETRLTSLERVIEDTRAYYWLGFTPDWKGDDRRHKIKLDVLRPGLKLRYREGFQDLSRSSEVDFMVESALLFGDLPGTGTLDFTMGPIPERGRKISVPLEIRIPMDEITLLPHQGRYVAELELRIAALDEFGDRNELTTIPVVLEGDGPAPLGAHSTYATSVQIRRRSQNLVVSLYDPAGDRLLVATTKFEP